MYLELNAILDDINPYSVKSQMRKRTQRKMKMVQSHRINCQTSALSLCSWLLLQMAEGTCGFNLSGALLNTWLKNISLLIMEKKQNKDERNTGACYNINIQCMIEAVASNNYLWIVKFLIWPYCSEYYILSKCDLLMCPIIICWL